MMAEPSGKFHPGFTRVHTALYESYPHAFTQLTCWSRSLSFPAA